MNKIAEIEKLKKELEKEVKSEITNNITINLIKCKIFQLGLGLNFNDINKSY